MHSPGVLVDASRQIESHGLGTNVALTPADSVDLLSPDGRATWRGVLATWLHLVSEARFSNGYSVIGAAAWMGFRNSARVGSSI
jgi:hypothetical protein